MEHLLRPTSVPLPPPANIPYICQNEYDGGPFLTYPDRIGKSYAVPNPGFKPAYLPYWQHEQHNPTPKQELESFFQTWLFFGLVNEVLGEVCSQNDFIRVINDEKSSKDITTTQLLFAVDRWVQKVLNDESKQSYDHVAECLCLANAALQVARPTFDSNLLIVLASIGEILEYATNKAFRIENLMTGKELARYVVSFSNYLAVFSIS